MNTGLQDRTVLVTGASGGIGSAIAQKFGEEGANLVLHYRSNAAAVHATQQTWPDRALVSQADLTNERQVREMFARAVRRFGRIDTVIANAGAWENADIPLHKMSVRQWRATLDDVLLTAFLTLREFFRLVQKQRTGNALLISSTAGVFGEAGHADYAAGKAAMLGLTRTLKNEISRIAPPTPGYCGGRVNCICPGWTRIPRTEGKLKAPGILEHVTATMALPKVGTADDIAHAAVFLSSDRLADHITGETQVIAGGMEGRLLWPPPAS
jgi:3-oxoacyl-[acyl-carrier protein] reductase